MIKWRVCKKCRKHYKWPRRLMIKFFLWAAYNAYVLMDYVKPHCQPGHRTFTFHSFLKKLFEELAGENREGRISLGKRRSESDLTEKRFSLSSSHDVIRPTIAATNNRCVVCSKQHSVTKQRNPELSDSDLPKRKKTVYKCDVLWRLPVYRNWRMQSLVGLAPQERVLALIFLKINTMLLNFIRVLFFSKYCSERQGG